VITNLENIFLQCSKLHWKWFSCWK